MESIPHNCTFTIGLISSPQQVYREWFRRNSHLKCVSQPEIAKNLLKALFRGFKVVQGHRCWYPQKARQQCLLW